MEILSSLRMSKTILAIVSLFLLSNFSAQAQQDLVFTRPATKRDIILDEQKTVAEIEGVSLRLQRSSFPDDFLFGVGSSAMQIEGTSGRGKTIWDARVEINKDTYHDADKYWTKIDHLNRYKEDVQHLKRLGLNSYRFSIAWSRVLPDGTLKGGINQEGIDFYNNLIDELLANGITPFVTILHFDYPLSLKQKLGGGFTNHSIVKHYKDYSELLFKTYGDRVKYWTTVNEVEVTALWQYMHSFDPKIPAEACQITRKCKQTYELFHNFLLSHAAASNLYREKYQKKQGGQIGLVLSSQEFVPYSSKKEDVAAAKRQMEFYIGWVLDPVFRGDYPKIMRKLVGNRLPRFTEKERKMIKGSTDFIGVNYYSSHFGKHEPNRTKIDGANNYDSLSLGLDFNAEGKPIGYKEPHGWSLVYPEGLYNVLQYIKKKYHNPKIYITENGIASNNMTNLSRDEHRIAYIGAHLNATKTAIDNGVNVRGYFVWSAFDTFEFQAGYIGNWGLYHIDFNDNLKRVPTDAAEWYKKFLTTDSVPYTKRHY